jgi:hypothetical protein
VGRISHGFNRRREYDNQKNIVFDFCINIFLCSIGVLALLVNPTGVTMENKKKIGYVIFWAGVACLIVSVVFLVIMFWPRAKPLTNEMIIQEIGKCQKAKLCWTHARGIDNRTIAIECRSCDRGER